MADETPIRQRFEAVRGQLDERGLRLLAAAEARAAGYGGIAAAARATGIARSTIGRGLLDLDEPALPPGRVRRPGSGRKPVREKDPTLLADLRCLVEPATLGDPMRPLLWVSKSHAKLADALRAMGHPISPNTVGKLLREELGYSRQTNRKTLEGASHPDRDGQFGAPQRPGLRLPGGGPAGDLGRHQEERTDRSVQERRQRRPAERLARGGQRARLRGQDPGQGGAVRDYDPLGNRGWVSLGIDHDTAEFAVNAIRTWHERVGSVRYAGS